MRNQCFQAHAAVSVLICSHPPQSVIMAHLHGRGKDILLKIVPMSRVWEENDVTSDTTSQEVLCSVSAALLNLACGAWLSCSGTECCRPPLPSGPRSVLTGPGRLRGAAVEMESWSAAAPGATGAADPRPDEMPHMLNGELETRSGWKTSRGCIPIQPVYSANAMYSKCETNWKHFNRLGLSCYAADDR